MVEFTLRAMEADDWDEVAELICLGTNHWYQTHGMGPIFLNGPTSALLFCEVYESLDPGCCILAVNEETGKIAGSCFYHPRESHVSLGIMNVHPNYFGNSIARKLLDFVIHFADREEKPIRLVSSALNLDSFSLYNRRGFVPRQTFQDMYLKVPESGLSFETPGLANVRKANLGDVRAMLELELELSHISREKDFRYFIENESDCWHVSVFEEADRTISGFLVSIFHPGSNMLGPGVARTEMQSIALIHAELNHHAGRSPVFLVPVQKSTLVNTMYRWGARNCEIHFSQVRGDYREPSGVVMPTFMPETA